MQQLGGRMALVLLVGISVSFLMGSLSPAAAQSPARRLQQGQIAEQVYQEISDLPREDNYIDAEANAAAATNTLVNRLARYHYYVKGRSTQSRLDWKLTLADYLGANERIDPSEYPFASRFDRNPLSGDRTAIAGLSRQTRDRLVWALIAAFHPELVPMIQVESEAVEMAAPTVPVQAPIITAPGAADLLR